MFITPFKSLAADTLQERAKFIHAIRQFFHSRGVLEVTTPLLAETSVTDPNIGSVKCLLTKGEKPSVAYLQTSPEYAMKRLLAEGSGSIYQICPAFRDDAPSSIHRVEFTMLEWYRVGYNYKQLMAEVSALIQLFWPTADLVAKTYHELFLEYLACDIADCPDIKLRELLQYHTNSSLALFSRDDYLDALFSLVIQPQLKDTPFLFVYDFPSSQAALAKVANGVAERFELFVRGVEIANGYSELTDAIVLEERFKENNIIRASKDLPTMSIDQDFMSAMTAGLPICAGVAVGIDRLFMLFSEHVSI